MKRLSDAVVKVVGMPEIQKKFLAAGAIPHAMDATRFAAFLRSEDQRWSKVIAQSGIKAD